MRWNSSSVTAPRSRRLARRSRSSRGVGERDGGVGVRSAATWWWSWVVAKPERKGAIADIIFRETTTIGLRHGEVARECLQRELVTVDTPLGAVRFKGARRDGRVVNAAPEFDDCARLAAAHNLPVKEVQAIAQRAYKS